MTIRAGLERVGRSARLLLLSGLFVVPLLPVPHGLFLPVLPVLVSMLIGLALCRLDLPAIMADLADPRFLLLLFGGIALFHIGAAMLLHGVGQALGWGAAVLLILVSFATAPTLTSAPNIALLLGYDARLTLIWTLATTFFSPLLIPRAGRLRDGVAD